MHKGFDLLIKAFCIFAKNNNEWTLNIVGEGVEEEMYYKLITEHYMPHAEYLSSIVKRIQTSTINHTF